jgi:translation initiation factor 5A
MTTAKELKAGNYVNINNEVLKVVRKEVVAYGTHSHSKTKLFVQGLFSKGEKSFNLNHHDHVDVLDIIRKKGQAISKSDDKVQVMDIVSYETIDADADPELFSSINEGDEVTFINYKGRAMVLGKK